ncbi:MAG TPA: hypothetical protein VEB22_01715 [Phycisphaerales bacterium]|nr:hypothetical protein [Phycisphaerales bacterium]
MNTTLFPLRPRRGRLSALVAVNALLLAATLGALLTPRADAQVGSPRARGSYLMVSGRASGVSGNVVYIVDSVNQELVALRYQRAAGRLEPIDYRSIAADSAEGAKSR